MRRSGWLASRAGLALTLTLLARPAASREVILHEYVPPPGVTSSAVSRDTLPPAIRVEDRVLPQPASEPTRAPGERLHDNSVRPDRATSLEIDRSTTRDRVLNYSAEFNPSVVPFKRMGSFDRVEQGYRLAVRDGTLRTEPLALGPTPPDRDVFWGSLLLSMQPGKAVPIPSVAPEARIQSYKSTPAARFTFYRDSADNFWARADRSGQLRLVFLTDAPRHYFSPQIPPTVTTADVPARLRPTLPAEVERAAATVIRRIDVRPGATLLRQLDRLVAYFRSFEAGELPARSEGDVYLDIAVNQRGVCRHRSFAFVVTAHALGIPARYVQNEAHAFIEVFVPRLGWARIDLGGASDELRVHNNEDKAVHDPGPDPFPRPTRYANGYSQLGTRVSGVRPAQRLRRRSTAVSLRAYDRSAGPAVMDPTGNAPARPGTARRTVAGPAEDIDGEEGADGEGAERPEKAPTEVMLFSPTRVVYRGEQVQVWGRVSSEGRGVAGLPVEIYLSRDGKTGEALLGNLVSGADGRFRTALPVPRGVAVGEYQVFAATAGDSRYESALSR